MSKITEQKRDDSGMPEDDSRVPQTKAEARELWGLDEHADLYDIYGSASVFLR